MKRLTVTFENTHCAFVAGYGARQLLTEMRGRPPIWSTLTRAWCTTEQTARDLIAIAERRGFEVVLGTKAPGEGRW